MTTVLILTLSKTDFKNISTMDFSLTRICNLALQIKDFSLIKKSTRIPGANVYVVPF